jgi:hypothetical protein
MFARFVILAAGLACASPALCESFASSGHLRPSISAVMMHYESKAKDLKSEMAMLQASDRGQLTPEHHAFLQAKADALIAAYRQDLAKVDPLSINADGAARR